MRDAVTAMAERVDRALLTAVDGLTRRDVEACRGVVSADHEVNELHRQVRELAFTTILTEAPVAGDLRTLLGLLHVSSELERIGDHCVSVAKIGITLAALPDLGRPLDLTTLAGYVAEQVRDAFAAMIAGDPDRARAVAARDDRVDRTYHRVFDDLIEIMSESTNTIYQATNLLFVAHHLERIADRATNIAEDVVFLCTGQIEELG